MSVVAWLGLGLGVGNLIMWFAVVVAARRLWRKLSPWLAIMGLGKPSVVERVGEYTAEV